MGLLLKPNAQRQHLAQVLLLAGWLTFPVCAAANEVEWQALSAGETPTVVAAANEQLTTQDLTDLRFHEFFKLPIGPRGLEATDKLQSLAGKRIRIVGYMARQETPASGYFVLSPLPVSLGEEDESLADDLPASVVFVHMGPPGDQPLPFSPGLLRVSGTLSLGAFEEADGHVSSVRLQLDPEIAQAMAARQSLQAN